MVLLSDIVANICDLFQQYGKSRRESGSRISIALGPKKLIFYTKFYSSYTIEVKESSSFIRFKSLE